MSEGQIDKLTACRSKPGRGKAIVPTETAILQVGPVLSDRPLYGGDTTMGTRTRSGEWKSFVPDVTEEVP